MYKILCDQTAILIAVVDVTQKKNNNKVAIRLSAGSM